MAQRWEYCVVGPVKFGSFVGWEGYYSKSVMLTSSGYQEKNMAGDEQGERDRLAVEIARLGNEGWEMTGVGSVGDQSRVAHYLYFKRPIG